MKKPLNYGISYKIKVNDNSYQDIDETYFSKKSALTRYLIIMDGSRVFPSSGPGSISELTMYRAFKDGTIEVMTETINKFLAN